MKEEEKSILRLRFQVLLYDSHEDQLVYYYFRSQYPLLIDLCAPTDSNWKRRSQQSSSELDSISICGKIFKNISTDLELCNLFKD